jgi:hypothetical protein
MQGREFVFEVLNHPYTYVRASGSNRDAASIQDWAVWFSFFLTSFSENLAVGRIWLYGESEYYYDYVWRKIKLFIGLRI